MPCLRRNLHLGGLWFAACEVKLDTQALMIINRFSQHTVGYQLLAFLFCSLTGHEHPVKPYNTTCGLQSKGLFFLQRELPSGMALWVETAGEQMRWVREKSTARLGCCVMELTGWRRG
ncbi:hypothetical protein LZ31DRAFT_79874 [Colletotrichum somersetense]|nr:hypothetical protein LZ31DRAFT_79874 [Colletotrichum somersetense]